MELWIAFGKWLGIESITNSIFNLFRYTNQDKCAYCQKDRHWVKDNYCTTVKLYEKINKINENSQYIFTTYTW